MWWQTQARPPLARQNVFFSSAPQASSGRARRHRQRQARRARSRASGAANIAPAAPASTRTTESSVRVWIGRSWTSSRSAIAAEALSASSSR